jgi:flagellar motor switch protein FliG
MSDAPNLSPLTLDDYPDLSTMQKLAALLVMLGPESAAQILKGMGEVEMESVSLEMAKLPMITPAVQVAILKEFTNMLLDASGSVRGGLEYVQSTLEKAVGLFKATNILSRVSPVSTPVTALRQIAHREPREIFNLIKHEQPQTFALIVSLLTPEKASQTVTMLPEQQRHEVLERLATLSPIPVEALEAVVQVLTQKLAGKTSRAHSQSGGLKAAADVLNALDKNLSQSVLVSIEERNPSLSQAIQQKMFTFDDLARLEVTQLQRILREVEMRDLAVALKTASEQVSNALLAGVSKRAAENVREEMSFLSTPKLKETQAVQTRIIDIARRLESEGEIEIDRTKEK